MKKRDTITLPYMVDIDHLNMQAIHLESLTAMLQLYFDSAEDGGDEISHDLLSGYLWQMQHTISELKESIRETSDNKIPQERLIDTTNH